MITKKKIRKIWTPLTITTFTEVVGSASQIYNSKVGTYTPDRTVADNVVKFVPHVMAITGEYDKSWTDGDYGTALQEVVWYANGKRIQEVDALKGGYNINTADENGTLTINKNLSPGDYYDLHFEGKLYDDRSASYLLIRSDAISLTISETAEHEWDFSVVHDINVRYYPLFDKLKEYDWKVENGIIDASEDARNASLDGNEYLRTLPIIISRGSNVIDDTYKYWPLCEMRMFIHSADGKSRRYYATSEQVLSFVQELNTKQITVDLRLVPDGTVLELALFVDGVKTASEFLTFTYIVGDYSCEILNGGDIDTKAAYRYDKAVFMINGNRVQYPEAYFDIRWYTNSSDMQDGQMVPQGTGETCKIDMTKAHLGTADNCWIEVCVDTKVKAMVSVITVDEYGNSVLVNSEGKVVTADMLVN